ncbi:MAG: TolC family protein [Saprospiraceae bacterium]|nr:TolC family protein [Saprospiraceae bacterium]
MITLLKSKPGLLLLLLSGASSLLAQHPVIERYVQEGLNNNLLLKQEQVALEKNKASVEAARRLSYPTIALQGSYTLATGGRAIDLPIGDLLNPVYATLNEMTQTNQFPMLENVREQLSPNNFADVKVRASMPVINPDIRINRNAEQEKASIQELEIGRARRDLTYQIKAAYFNYLQAGEAVKIYESALELLKENLRVNQSLLKNDKINKAPVLRIEAEISKVNAEIAQARTKQLNAASYFNTLLHRPMENEIELAPLPSPDSLLLAHTALQLPDVQRREEIQQLDKALQLNQLSMTVADNFNKPRLNAFVDLGAQGFLANLDNRAPYAIAGLQLEWTLWNGNRNRWQERQVALESQQLNLRRQDVVSQFELKQKVAVEDVRAAYESLKATNQELASATEYFRVVDRSYREGMASYIEYLDARTQLTNARLQKNLKAFNLWGQIAAMERELIY